MLLDHRLAAATAARGARTDPPILVELELQELMPKFALMPHVVAQVEVVGHSGSLAQIVNLPALSLVSTVAVLSGSGGRSRSRAA
jgi:hypothetical protein